jgi:hypothetical protein
MTLFFGLPIPGDSMSQPKSQASRWMLYQNDEEKRGGRTRKRERDEKKGRTRSQICITLEKETNKSQLPWM